MRVWLIAVPVVMLAAGSAFAGETDAWKLFAKTGLALTQSSLSDNWSGSETGSIAWTWTFLGEAERQVHPKALWSNTLNTAFGQMHQYDRTVDRWERAVKSTDKIRFDSVVRFTLGAWVDPYLAGYFKSQFYDERAGYDDEPLNPALFSESGGVARAILEEEGRKLVTRVGIAFRQRRDAYGPEKEWSNDGGVEWVTDWRFATEGERTVYLSKLTVYRALYFSESDETEGTPMGEYWESPDVDWENTLTNRLTEYLSLDLYFELVYDKQIDKAGQYKQTLGVGLAYQFL